MVLIEVAVEALAAAKAAALGGADRIELCADLSVGGITPSDELTRRVLDQVGIAVFAMVRPRAGGFVYSGREIAHMCCAAERLRAQGVHGVVTGALTSSGDIDVDATAALLSAASGTPLTFHRAFDLVVDQSVALEQLVELGVSRGVDRDARARLPRRGCYMIGSLSAT